MRKLLFEEKLVRETDRRAKKDAHSDKYHCAEAVSGDAATGIMSVICVWRHLAQVRKLGFHDLAPVSRQEGLLWNNINSQAFQLSAGIIQLA